MRKLLLTVGILFLLGHFAGCSDEADRSITNSTTIECDKKHCEDHRGRK